MNILGTTEISYRIEKLIQEETSFLIIVSPYLKLTNRLKAKLDKYLKDIKKVYFLYRENELPKKELEWLTNHSNIKLMPIENLHAKIYINEIRCLVTSMNLYEYSQVNNHEIGIEITADENKEEFYKILEEINLMISSQDANKNIQPILDLYYNFSVGKLFEKITKEYKLYPYGYKDDIYITFCTWARRKVHFEPIELYQDKTAILRATNLGRKRYEILKHKISIDIFNKPD